MLLESKLGKNTTFNTLVAVPYYSSGEGYHFVYHYLALADETQLLVCFYLTEVTCIPLQIASLSIQGTTNFSLQRDKCGQNFAI